MAGDPRDEGRHVLRFRRQDEDVRFPREVRHSLERGDAVLRRDLFRASRDRIADEDSRCRDDPPDDQAPDERFTHLAHARDSDCLLGVHEIPPRDVCPRRHGPSFSFSFPGNCITRKNTSEPSLTNVDLRHDDLVDLVGKSLSIEEFVDRITFMGAGPQGVQGDVMTFDVFPNRPDLYSVEGIARGLRGFLGMEVGLPVYRAEASGIDFIVDRSVADVRPYAVGGIVRGLELEDALLRSLVDLQEKLHLTVGRRRKKVAIGIHDMDKVTPPYTYKAVLPPDVRFTPLGMAQEMDLLDILTRHEKGREYAHLVASQPDFPIITDAKGQMLSFPPVINGILTQLTPDTRNLFIDVTGTDFEAVNGCLAILMTALAERGGRIQTVTTKYFDRTFVTPDLAHRAHSLVLRRANELLGLSLKR